MNSPLTCPGSSYLAPLFNFTTSWHHCSTHSIDHSHPVMVAPPHCGRGCACRTLPGSWGRRRQKWHPVEWTTHSRHTSVPCQTSCWYLQDKQLIRLMDHDHILTSIKIKDTEMCMYHDPIKQCATWTITYVLMTRKTKDWSLISSTSFPMTFN